MPRKKKSDVEKVAAAAAAAAVKATNQHESVAINWGAEEEDDEDLQDDVLEDLEQIDEAAGGDITWELYCDVPLDKAGQVRKLGRTELRTLRDECLALGPGEYHVVARGPKGKFVPRSRRNIKISGFARGTAPAAPATPAIDPTALFRQYEERAERLRLEAQRERQAQIKFWAPILAPIGIEMAKGLFGRSSGDSIKDLVGALVGMKELNNGGDKSVETLLKGMELARDMAPDAKGSTWPDVLVNGVTSLAKEFRPLAESLAQRRNGPPAPAGTPQLRFAPATPPQQPTPPAAAIPASTPTPEADMWVFVEPILRKLATELEEFAANATDPQLTAEALWAKVPRLIKGQVTAEQLKEWLTAPNWWEAAATFHPGLQAYMAFCDDVRQELLAIVTDPGPGQDPEEEDQPT